MNLNALAREQPPQTTSGSALVVIPTYCEALNLNDMIRRVRQATPAAHVLVVDDNSPDGTGDLADELAGFDSHVHVLHRAGKGGLGAAYLAGFAWGRAHDFDVLVEMDADGSHQPEQLQSLLDAVDDGADLVIGSRWIRGGEVQNWPLHRKILSRGGNLYARFVLGAGINDITGGYRAIRATALTEMNIDAVESAGYCFQVDVGWRAIRAGLDVREVPITFIERVHGESKMSSWIVIEALLRVTAWGAKHRLSSWRSPRLAAAR